MRSREEEERLERALTLARAGRTADVRRDLMGAVELYQKARDLIDDLEPTPLLANLLRWEGSVLRDRGKIEEADDLYRQSLEAAEASGSLAGRAAATNCRAVIAQRRGEIDEAVELYRIAVRLAAEAGEIRLRGMIEQNLGVLANIRGDLDAARERYEAALRAFDDVGDGQAASWVLNNLGMLFNDLGDWSSAEAAFDRGLTIARSRGDRPLEGVLLANRAEGLIAIGRWKEAFEALDTAFAIAGEGDEVVRMAEVVKFRGMLERDRGNHDAALQRFREALGVARSVGDRLLEGEVLRERGELHLLLDDAAAAASDWSAALAAFETSGASGDAASVRDRLDDLEARTSQEAGQHD